MTGTLARYLSRQFLVRSLAVLVALTALLQLLDLLDAASRVLERGGALGDLGTYALLRLPSIVERLVPLAVLVGSLTTLYGLVQNNEIVAMRSAGLTPYQLLATLMPAAVAIAVFHLILSDQIAPRAERAFLTWWAETEPPTDDDLPLAEKKLWLRVGNTIVAAERVLERGARLEQVSLYPRDDQGRVTERIRAAAAVYGDGNWTLLDGTRLDLTRGDFKAEPFARAPWPVRLHPANVVEVLQPTENIPLLRLRSILRGDWAGRQSPAYYETRLHETYAGPLATLIMVLLAAPVAHGMRRSGAVGGSMALGIGIGLTYLLADGMLAALGEAGAMPAVIAAWAPTVFFAAVGGAILVHVEG